MVSQFFLNEPQKIFGRPQEVVMSNPQTAPYGSWSSPITSDLIVASTIGLSGILLDGTDVYWHRQLVSAAQPDVNDWQ